MRSFLCSKCPKTYKLSHHLKAHELTHGEEKKFCCSDCKQSFYDKKSLKSHIKSHSEKDLFCNFCVLKFKHKSNLKSHIKTHIGEKKYKCGECQKFFLTIPYLKRHMQTHKNTKYKCGECQKLFLTIPDLKRHITTHKNFRSESPKALDGCTMQFEQTLVGEKTFMLANYTNVQGDSYKCTRTQF